MLTKRHYSLRIETPVNGLMSCGLTQEWLTGGQAAGGETCRLMSSSRGATVCWQSGLEPWTNKHRSPFLIRPCGGQKLFQKAAFLRHGVSDRLCRWTGRRWTRLAVSRCVNDLRNSRRSQRTERKRLYGRWMWPGNSNLSWSSDPPASWFQLRQVNLLISVHLTGPTSLLCPREMCYVQGQLQRARAPFYSLM